MAKKIAYDETSVVRSLSKKSSIQINTTEKIIKVVDGNTEVGNGSWGKIDYLTKVHGYIVLFVKNISRKFTSNKSSDNEDKKINSKTAKREAKLNMAAMAKSAMRKAKTK